MTRCSDCGVMVSQDGLCPICLLAGALEPQGDLPVPGRVGSYRILRLLGSGGMGTVYEAEQEQPWRIVALKLIRPGLMDADLVNWSLPSGSVKRFNTPTTAESFIES